MYFRPEERGEWSCPAHSPPITSNHGWAAPCHLLDPGRVFIASTRLKRAHQRLGLASHRAIPQPATASEAKGRPTHDGPLAAARDAQHVGSSGRRLGRAALKLTRLLTIPPSSYISADTYVFEPASAQPGGMLGDKVERETLTVDRKTGSMTLNGGLRRLRAAQRHGANASEDTARDARAPLGPEKVITCYGIIGIVTLATSACGCRRTHGEPSS